MLPQENVSQLNDYEVYENIIAFLDEFDQKTNDKRQNRNMEKSNTRISYQKNLREFFKILLNKDIEHLKEDDLNFKKRDIISYRKHLQQSGNSNSTVNQKMASIKSCMVFLNSEHNVNVSAFELKRLDETTQSYGIINQTEAELFAETAFQTEREKQYLKKMLILVAIRTSFRLDELLNLKWNNFEYVDGVYKVSIRGKRNKLVSNAISAKLYNQLLELKEINKQSKWNGDPEIIFQISTESVNRMMNRLRKKLNIDSERNVVFHSFRKVAINWELETSGRVDKAAQQGNHSSIDVLYKNYIDNTRDYTQAAGVRMEEEIDLGFLDNLTVEDFKEFIKQSGYKVQLDLVNYVKNR
ncbi:site-specific integrase [Bacillus xiapuensis]|uniref:Site-specific integrase n=1 Tax=Bacillus xiapuensis TaxID=2014075 RepID=A0ABU6NAR0_9BACI|nr:site-specific integrase [Bacillus xiapuensis]